MVSFDNFYTRMQSFNNLADFFKLVLSNKVFFVDSTKQMAMILEEYAPQDAVILVKGSNSMRMTEVYKYIERHEGLE